MRPVNLGQLPDAQSDAVCFPLLNRTGEKIGWESSCIYLMNWDKNRETSYQFRQNTHCGKLKLIDNLRDLGSEKQRKQKTNRKQTNKQNPTTSLQFFSRLRTQSFLPNSSTSALPRPNGALRIVVKPLTASLCYSFLLVLFLFPCKRSSPQASVLQDNPLPACSLQGLQVIPAQALGTPLPPVPSVLAVCFSHFSPHTWAGFFPSSLRLSPGATIVSMGLSCALWWVCWIWLAPAVSSMGQTQPLLTETPAAPDTWCKESGFNFSLNLSDSITGSTIKAGELTREAMQSSKLPG